MDWDCRYEVRCKLLKLVDGRDNERELTGNREWKDMGTGQLQILYRKGPLQGKHYLLMRDEKLGRIVLDTVVVSKMKFIAVGKSNIRFFAKIPEPEVDKARSSTTRRRRPPCST